MPEETFTREDAEKMTRRGWEILNRAGEREDALGCGFGYRHALAYVDDLGPDEVACLVAALLDARERLALPAGPSVPVTLRHAVANAVLGWRRTLDEDPSC